MHIAVGLNWIPEMLQLPHLQHHHRQHHSLHQLLFTLELTARLALQNAMPSTLSIARLTLNVLSTLISGECATLNVLSTLISGEVVTLAGLYAVQQGYWTISCVIMFSIILLSVFLVVWRGSGKCD